MATVTEFALDARIALQAAGLLPQVSGFREEQRVAVGAYRALFRVVEAEEVTAGSNATVVIVTAEAEIVARSNGLLVNDRAVEEGVATFSEIVADPAFWTALASVRISPLPEIDFADQLERVGNVCRITVSVQVALEA